MRKKVLYLCIFIAICIIIEIAYSLYRYYAPPKLRQPYQINATPDDTLRIAFIGDSWAFMHKDHDCMIAQMLQDTLHRPVKVHSYGVCGLTSKEIYENIFDNYAFKIFFLKRKYQYCFISAGINDTYKKMSTDYYQQSMDGIIQFLLYNNIRPIILEIPDYNIQKTYDWLKPSKKILRHLSMLINHIPIDCKQQFRNSFDSLICNKNYQNEVSIIRYQSWNYNYFEDQDRYYRHDGMHLNAGGYEQLDKMIINEITNSYYLSINNK